MVFQLDDPYPTLVGLTLNQFDMLLGFKSARPHGRTQTPNPGYSYFIQKTQVFLLLEFFVLLLPAVKTGQ